MIRRLAVLAAVVLGGLVPAHAQQTGEAPAAAAATGDATHGPKRAWVGVGGFTGAASSAGPKKPVGTALEDHDLGTPGNDERMAEDAPKRRLSPVHGRHRHHRHWRS